MLHCGAIARAGIYFYYVKISFMAAIRGTQSIERALLLLRELSARARPGWRLTDIAERCGLDRGTASRILSCLVRERFAVKRRGDRHYLPGPALYELGHALPEMHAFEVLCRLALARLAARTRCVAFLYLRSGNDFVCVAREGVDSVKGLSIEVGTRRALCLSAGGVAILVALPAAARAAVKAENLRRVRRARDRRLPAIERMLRRSEGRGAGVNLGDVVPRITALSVPICGPSGLPFASLTVSGPVELLPRDRVEETLAAIAREVRAIEEKTRPALTDLGF
jgi:DNA-binding IclR family transcriptional regulator